MERLTLEQINNMTESQMREHLRGIEIENQLREQKEQNQKMDDKKFMDEFFDIKFKDNIKPKFNGQY